MSKSRDVRAGRKPSGPGTPHVMNATKAPPDTHKRRRPIRERPPYDASLAPWARMTGWQLDGMTHVACRARVALWSLVGVVGAGAVLVAVLARMG